MLIYDDKSEIYKPDYGTAIDKSVSYTQSLAAAWLLNEGAGTAAFDSQSTNSASVQIGLSANFDWSNSVCYSPVISSFANSFTAGYLKTTTTDSFIPLSGGCTVAVAYKKGDLTNKSASVFGLSAGTANQRCGASIPYSDGNVYWDFGGFTNGTNRCTWSGWTPDTLWHIWCFSTGARGMEIWLDGVLKASNAANPSRLSTGDKFCLLSGNGASGQNICSLGFLYLFKKQLPIGSIKTIAASPFCMFAEPDVRVITPAAAGLTVITAAATIPAEILSSAQSSATAPLAWLGSLVASGSLPLELLATAAAGRTLPLELLGTAAAGQTVPAEWLATPAAAVNVPAEWLAVVQANQIAIAEILSGASAGAITPLEWLATMQGLGVVPIDWTGAAGSAGSIWTLGPRGQVWVLDYRGQVWQLPPRATTFTFNPGE